MPERRRRRRRRKKSLLLLLGECLDGDDETIEKKMSLLSLSLPTHLRMKATEPFLRANRALSDVFLAATIWATLTPV